VTLDNLKFPIAHYRFPVRKYAMHSAPCRIAFGITELDPGGAERMLTELVTRLDRGEWEPHVICLGPEAHYAQVLREQGIPVTCFGASGLLGAPRTLWRWTRELRQFQPEILYTWLFHANLLGRLAGRWAGVPRILSGVRVAEKRNRWHGRWDRWTNSLVNNNVCVSQDVARFLERDFGFDPAKSVVIPNGVDPARFRDVVPTNLSEFGIPPGSRVLITVGRIERQKGIDVLLSAAGEIVQQLPDVHFLIVGAGPDRDFLERQAVARGLADRLHWAGHRTDVPGLLAASTAFILPSRWEGMPNAVLEALAAGKPVVATRAEGTPELVRDGINGWLVGIEQPQELAEAVVRLLSDRPRLPAMGRESQHICNEQFTVDRFVARHVELFRQVREQSVRKGPRKKT
jgi:glycosyltransferase involved in cell wall biosynthesis